MPTVLKKFLSKKMLLSLALFSITFCLLAYAVKELWFREDDLGVIINGLITSWDDFIRVFSADERSLACPVNYLRTNPNFISGFARPLKNIFFSLIYFFQGLNVFAYYYLHVFFHALNVTLFFHLLSLWIPLGFAFLGGLMFAFYPDISWFTWIAAFHNSLALFFLLLSLIFYHAFWVKQKSNLVSFHLLLGSGLSFFLSLISRENGIFFPFWIFSGIFLVSFFPQKKLWFSFKIALAKTWIFFAVNLLYILYRILIFGTASLDRTYNNLFLRFPFLTKFLNNPFNTETITSEVQKAVIQTLATTEPLVSSTLVPIKVTLWESIASYTQNFMSKLFSWNHALFTIDSSTTQKTMFIIFLWIFLPIFIYIAYKFSKKILLFLFIGIGVFIWPAFVAYPSTRYINCVYPILVTLLIFGIYQIMKKKVLSQGEIMVATIALCLACTSIYKGATSNVLNLHAAGSSNVLLKERYETFFKTHSFSPQVNFVLLGCPFGSDTQNIFQYFLNNFDIKLVEEPFSTLAERGTFSCSADYRSRGVKRIITPIPNGYRITSLDKDHCACWMNLSHHPLQWVEHEKAYRWRHHLHELDIWHPCSIGTFKIHERINNKYVTDVSFVFDKKWIDKNTTFITWDTMQGTYTILDSSHLT
ncbi:MAG: hypothetical protein V1855_02090 [bacterium]